MDINEILSLLKASNSQSGTDANTNQSTQQPVPANNTAIGNSQTASVATLPSIDLSRISADVIRQVQQEYWSQQRQHRDEEPTHTKQQRQHRDEEPTHTKQQRREEDPNSLDRLLNSISFKDLKSINSEVLVALGRMVKETNLMQVLRECRRTQDEKEQSLFEQRQNLMKKFDKRKDELFAEEMIGNKVDWKALEKEQQEELRLFDSHVLRETDKLVRSQQEQLQQLKVPFFRVSSDPSDIKMQHKVMSILLDMMEE